MWPSPSLQHGPTLRSSLRLSHTHSVDTPHVVYSLVDGQMGGFHILAIINNVVTNICTSSHVAISFQFSWVYIYLGVELLGRMVTQCDCQNVLQSGYTLYIPTIWQHMRVPVSPHPHRTLIICNNSWVLYPVILLKLLAQKKSILVDFLYTRSCRL